MSAPELEYPDLVDELRLAGPPPSEDLRAHVRRLSERPARGRRRWPLVAAVAMPVAAIGAAFAIGVVEGASTPERDDAVAAETMPSQSPAKAVPSREAAGGYLAGGDREATATWSQAQVRTPLAPNRTRAQQYRAELVVHVDDLLALSRATASAMELTGDMGGYLVSASQDSGADGRGYSSLVVRVPTENVQRALVRFAQLGTILDQQISVQDRQAQLDKLYREAQAMRARIAKLEAQLEAATTAVERERIQRQLRAAQLRLAELTGRSELVQRRASFARIALTLTTEESDAIVPVPEEPGPIERAWERSLDILVGEAVVLLYAVVVAGPFLLLAALALVAARPSRRRGREALLERS